MLVPFFEGPSTFERKIGLLILTGYEKDRAINLIDDLEPSAYYLARSVPGTAEEFEARSTEIADEIRVRREIEAHNITIPGNDPYKCKEELVEFFAHNSKYDFYVAPIGPKPAVLGLYLAYEQNQNFRIIYPFPINYNVENYSYGRKQIYEFF